MLEPTAASGIIDPGYNSEDQFDQLQKKLVALWKSIERFNQDPQTIVVVPSMSIDAIDSGAVMQAYEERPSVCLASHRLGSSTANPRRKNRSASHTFVFASDQILV